MSPVLPRVNLYRNISIFFVVVTIIILSAVFLLFYNQATIIVEVEDQDINLTFNVEVKDSPDVSELNEMDVVTGRLVSWEKTASGDFAVLSTKTANPEFVGQIEIVNDSTRDQPLLKTTQLQADNGVIVRTAEAVVVPASGSVFVNVYPKDENDFVDIDPQNLVIIKLGSSLQDSIYGINHITLTDDPREVNVLTKSDVSRSEEDLISQLIQEVKLENNLSDKFNLTAEIIKSEADKELGAEVETFGLEITTKIKTVEIDEEQLSDLLYRKMQNIDLTGMKISQINLDDVTYSIVDDDFGDDILMEVAYVLTAGLDASHPIFNRDNFIRKTADEVKNILYQSELIRSAEVYISPYWKDTMPKKASKIKVIIK